MHVVRLVSMLLQRAILVVELLLTTALASFVTETLRPNFVKSFHEKCSKYPFIKQFENKLENTGDKYLVFVFHEQGLRNGGFGDRLSGLVSAVGMALRFNRTLLIESANDFHLHFRPYHSHDISNMDNFKYTWGNWTSWSHYDIKFANNDATEYDLWDCLNNPAAKNRKCGMDDGDVPQPIIKLRSNRAHICRWSKHAELPASRDMAALGISKDTDLFEASGCLLRLALWPTERLWSYIDSELSKHENTLLHNSNSYPNTNAITTTSTPSAATYTAMESILPMWDHMVSTHFRCGDKGYMSHGSYDLNCMHSTTLPPLVLEPSDPNYVPVHDETSYMDGGTPISLGMCAAWVLSNLTNSADKLPLPPAPQQFRHDHHRHLRHRQLSSYLNTDTTHMKTVNQTLPYHSLQPHRLLQQPQSQPQMKKKKNILMFIASDNAGSSKQMATTINYTHSVVSPSGCHIEMDSSSACTILTTGYWFILSLSDTIVTQATPENYPVSAFSRYAAIYGLKDNAIRFARKCSTEILTSELGRRQQGNWFCE